MVRSILPWVVVAASLGRVMARSCVVFDSDMNLHVLGPSADYKLGAQASWSSGASAQALTAGAVRPPFDGDRPRCHLAQSHNVVYALGIDKSNPGAVWIYNFPANSWSMQAMATGDTPDPDNMWEVLDHDTNVIYAYSRGTMYFARFEEQIAATSSANAWTNQGLTFQFPPEGYQGTVANANNRVHFFGAPGTQPGQSYLYVVHFAYPQPAVQGYPSTTSAATFPASHGWAMSIFDPDNKAQSQVAFIPDNLAATYIVDSKKNQTLPMAAPAVKDSGSHFAGSTSAVVQLTSDGKVFYLPVTQSDIAGTGANSGAAWKQLATINVGSSGNGNGGGTSNSGGSPTTTGSGSSPTKGSTGAGSNSGNNSSNNSTTGNGTAPEDAAGHLASVSWVAAVAAFFTYVL